MKRLDRRYLAWVAGLLVLAVLPAIAGFTHTGWELSELLGWAGTLGCILLCGCPVRPRQSIPPTLLTLPRHELFGWLVLAAAALHAVVAVAADHTVIEYLKFTAPLYQLAGLVALGVLAALALSAAGRVRRIAWHSHRTFQAWHIVAGCLLLVLLAVHVAVTGRYVGGYPRRGIFIAVAAGAVLMLLRRRARGNSVPPEADLLRRSVFGRHARLIVGAILLTVPAVASLIPQRSTLALREPVVARSETPPLDFDHRAHTTVNCLVCHHNYADGKGFENCISCHRRTSPPLQVGVEARFHDFCLSCHREPEHLFAKHGPVSGCDGCHRRPADSSAALPTDPPTGPPAG